MSPNHQDRVQQNNCEHEWPTWMYYNNDIFIPDPLIKICTKCGILFYIWLKRKKEDAKQNN